jgi:dolichol-phosphate mannosyltransferase
LHPTPHQQLRLLNPAAPQRHRLLELAVVIPVLNERDNIEPLIAAIDHALRGRAYELLFVDDWSDDGTPQLIAEIARMRRDVRLVRRFGRRGLASAVTEGALASAAPVIAVMDGDGQHDGALLPRLADAVAAGADVAIGSRYCSGGSVGAWDAGRARGSRVATALARRILGREVTDPMSGFFAVRREVLLDALPRLANTGFKILFDILASAGRPLAVVELPYIFRNRTRGSSKLDAGVALDYLLMLLDKSAGRLAPARLILFGIVGGLGLIVHLAVLRSVLAGGFAFQSAQTAAVVVAIAFNFALNNQLTFRDRRLKGWAVLPGLFSFYAVCGLGALANIGVGSYVFAHDPKWWLAGLAGAAAGSLWNFVASSVTTWRPR